MGREERHCQSTDGFKTLDRRTPPVLSSPLCLFILNSGEEVEVGVGQSEHSIASLKREIATDLTSSALTQSYHPHPTAFAATLPARGRGVAWRFDPAEEQQTSNDSTSDVAARRGRVL
jgi:hypothetical protein